MGKIKINKVSHKMEKIIALKSPYIGKKEEKEKKKKRKKRRQMTCSFYIYGLQTWAATLALQKWRKKWDTSFVFSYFKKRRGEAGGIGIDC